MAKSSKIVLEIEQIVNGEKSVSKATVGLRELSKAAGIASKAARDMTASYRTAAISTCIDQAQRSMSALTDTVRVLTDAYAVQLEAETKLETVMRQRMDATDAQISSIKQLASAQQQLGIIGDEVQLAGAQQVATFLTETASIETLLPALNNLLAQQKGFSATGQDAVNIANLFGKAMQGQVSALKRVGITFSDAEANVMKFGSESERAAMLAQIITNNVGDMNAELAKTSAGKLKQLQNALGDVKEQAGKAVQGILPFITIVNQAVMLGGSVTKLSATFSLLASRVWNCTAVTRSANAIMRAFGLTLKGTTAATTGLGTASKVTTVAVRALGVAIRSAIIATGIGAIIWGITAAIDALSGSTHKATEETRNFGNAEREIAKIAAESVAKEMTELNRLYATAKDETKSRKDRADAVREMQRQYPGYFDNLRAENIEVSKLTKGYEDLSRAILNKAKIKAYEDKIAENTGKIIDIEDQLDNLGPTSTKSTSQITLSNGKTLDFTLDKSAGDPLAEGQARFNKGVESLLTMSKEGLEAENKKYAQKIEELQKDIPASTTSASGGSAGVASAIQQAVDDGRRDNLRSIDNAIAYYKAQAETVDKETYAKLKEIMADLQRQRDEFTGDIAPVFTPPINDIVTSWDDADKAIAHYSKVLREATTQEGRDAAQAHIDAINAITSTWQHTEDVVVPGAINTLDTIGKLDDAIGYWRDKVKDAGATERAEIAKTIRALEAKRKAYDRDAEILNMQSEVGGDIKVTAKAIGFDGLADRIRECNALLEDMDNPLTDEQRASVEALAKTYQNAQKYTKDYWASFKGGYQAISSLTTATSDMVGVWKSEESILAKLSKTISGFITVMDGIMAVVQIVKNLTAATAVSNTVSETANAVSQATQATKVAEALATAAAAVVEVPAAKAMAAANAELAASNALLANSGIPIVGGAIGASQAAAISAAYVASVATISSAVALASGGIANKPTLALIGEYAGASHNPEVVAPLDKLRGMIAEEAGGIGGKVTFKIDGRTLVGVLERETNVIKRR